MGVNDFLTKRANEILQQKNAQATASVIERSRRFGFTPALDKMKTLGQMPQSPKIGKPMYIPRGMANQSGLLQAYNSMRQNQGLQPLAPGRNLMLTRKS